MERDELIRKSRSGTATDAEKAELRDLLAKEQEAAAIEHKKLWDEGPETASEAEVQAAIDAVKQAEEKAEER